MRTGWPLRPLERIPSRSKKSLAPCRPLQCIRTRPAAPVAQREAAAAGDRTPAPLAMAVKTFGIRTGSSRAGLAPSPLRRRCAARRDLSRALSRHAHRLLEEHRQVGQEAALAPTHGAVAQASEVDHQRRGQRRVGSLPGELQAHACAEEALEQHMVPGHLPVAQRRHVADVDLLRRPVAEQLRQGLALAALLGGRWRPYRRACGRLLPRMFWRTRTDAQVGPRTRAQHGLDQRLAVCARPPCTAPAAAIWSSAGILEPTTAEVI